MEHRLCCHTRYRILPQKNMSRHLLMTSSHFPSRPIRHIDDAAEATDADVVKYIGSTQGFDGISEHGFDSDAIAGAADGHFAGSIPGGALLCAQGALLSAACTSIRAPSRVNTMAAARTLPAPHPKTPPVTCRSYRATYPQVFRTSRFNSGEVDRLGAPSRPPGKRATGPSANIFQSSRRRPWIECLTPALSINPTGQAIAQYE